MIKDTVLTNVKVYQETLEISTRGEGFTDISTQIAAIVARSGIFTGLCTLFVQHTSASLVIQENADPSVLRDLTRWMSALVQESRQWEHDEEGPDDMPSHIRTMITRTSETIPITSSHLALGQWQAIYLWEHRRHARNRRIIVHLNGLA
jgi:secondary thiamine-phosphate synthase enzyme